MEFSLGASKGSKEYILKCPFSFRHGGVGASVGVRSLASIPSLPPAVAEFVKGAVDECKPNGVHVVTGTPEETANILAGLEKEGMVKKLPKYENW